MTTASSTKEIGTGTTTTEDFFKNTRITWIVLAVSLMITAAATLYMKSSVEKIAEKDFADRCNEIQSKVSERMDNHARILHGGLLFLMPPTRLHVIHGGSIRNIRKLTNNSPVSRGSVFRFWSHEMSYPGTSTKSAAKDSSSRRDTISAWVTWAHFLSLSGLPVFLISTIDQVDKPSSSRNIWQSRRT